MKPAPFDYIRADSAEDAVHALAEYGGDALILAGGQSLLPLLNMRLAQPKALIDISRASDLAYIRAEGRWLAIGAAVTQAQVERWPELENEIPLLARVLPHVAHVQIRSRGTVCGAIAHADPSAELPLCLVALEGEVVLRSRSGGRTINAADFFLGALTTAKNSDELISEVRFPLRKPGAGYAFEEFSPRHGDFAIAAVVAIAEGDTLRFAVGGVAEQPVATQ
jgi:2-furoyl-CoA dehydrogenase FAD binding subunit